MRFSSPLVSALMVTALLGGEAHAQATGPAPPVAAGDFPGSPVASPEGERAHPASSTTSPVPGAPAPPPVRTEPYSTPLAVSGIVVGALGAGALATGVVVLAAAPRDCGPDEKANCELPQGIGALFLAGGTLGAALGLSLWGIGSSEVPVEEAAVEPWVVVGVGGVVVGGAF